MRQFKPPLNLTRVRNGPRNAPAGYWEQAADERVYEVTNKLNEILASFEDIGVEYPAYYSSFEKRILKLIFNMKSRSTHLAEAMA